MRLRNKNIVPFLLLFLYTFSCSATSKIQEEKLKYNTLFTDHENRLWIGSETGLFIWKNSMSSKIQLVGNINITAILVSENVALIGTNEGKIYCYNEEYKTLKLIADLKSEISSICLHGDLLAISSKGNGYALITPYAIKHITTKQGLTDNFVYKVWIDKQLSVWSSTDLGINIESPDGTIKESPMNHKIPDRLVTCFDIADSMLYCGTQQGDLCKINLHNGALILLDHAIWNSAQINDLKLLDRSIAVATEYGAFLLDENGHLIESILTKKAIKKIEVDCEGNLWFCGNHLLASSSGEQLTLMKQFGDVPILNVHAIYADSSHNIYLTPDQGLLKYNSVTQNLKQVSITPPKDLIDITSIFRDAHGHLWIGTTGKGLFLVDTSSLSFQKINLDQSVETSAILSITGDKETIWVSSLNGVWYSHQESGIYKFSSLEDQYKQKKYYVYDVKKDSRNNVWLATDGQGVLKISSGQVYNFTSLNKIHSSIFFSVDEDAENQMWFNAYADGLYCLRGDSIFHLTQEHGLSSNDILSIQRYGKDYMVTASSNGIDLVNIHNFAVSSFNFESLHLGAPVPETNSISADNNENMYIGTNLGVLKLYIPTYRTCFVPKARIDEILVMGKFILPKRNKFNYEENYFKFLISSCYNAEQITYYRYQLKGLSEQWCTTIDKEVVFPRLNPGHYEFILQTSNNSRFLNATEDRYDFTILSPFWKQTWFICLVLSLFTVLIYYYIRFREARVSKVQQLEKEKAIAEFETLKHQVSPHFLFNSFNTLIQVIDEDKEKAIEYTQMLSDYYRSILSYHNVNLVSLEEEFMLLDKYMYLQKMRFGDSLHLLNKCPSQQIMNLEIPPLTLQLLAENAIKHNVISSSKPLTIFLSLRSDYLVVANNLNEKNNKEAGENIGLENIKNRFKLFSDQHVEIRKTNKIFEVRLPILKN